MSVHHIESVQAFDDLVAQHRFVVADFYADWCGPCKAIAPVYEKLAAEHGVAGQLAFAKINVDRVPAVGARYNVTAMPTFLFFAGGGQASISVHLPPGATGAVVGERGVEYIRGADPQALTAVAARLGQLAKAAAA